MSQQEDDLRALAKIMDFLRAVSIVLVVANLYWFTRVETVDSGWFYSTVHKICANFNRTCGLFSTTFNAKLFALMLLTLSCFGTKGVKNEKITWVHIGIAVAIGAVLFFLNWWMPAIGWRYTYIITTVCGYVCLLMGGIWIGRRLKNNMMDDRFNDENESFMQETRLLENEFSVNLPTKFYYEKKWHRGYINVVNPFRASIVLGTPGSGKSFSAKREIANAFLVTDDDIIINDPEGEYSPLVNRLKGQVIKISPNSTQFINPMDINANYSEEDNPLSLKADFILSLCELVVGGKEGLLPVEKTVIDRCVHLIYRKYFADPCPENMPILEDLYNALLQQDEKEAHHVATALEIYVKGSLNLFNHRTNVNVNNRIVCYDIKELGKQMKKLGMLIVQDQVWGRVTANRSSGKSTRYYMDEMHLLLKEEQTAAYSVEIWKRFRKWGGIPTGLTQNVKDLLSSREVENIFENSDMIIMLNQAAGDRQILAKQLNISPHQLSYVTHSGEGEGLLFFGNVILPFVDRFPTDLELYRIMTTKLGEVSEGTQK